MKGPGRGDPEYITAVCPPGLSRDCLKALAMGHGGGSRCINGHLEFNIRSQKELHKGSGDAEEEARVSRESGKVFPGDDTGTGSWRERIHKPE